MGYPCIQFVQCCLGIDPQGSLGERARSFLKARSKKGDLLLWAGSSTFLHAPEVQADLSVLGMGLCACVRACVCVCAYGWDVRV